MIQQKFIFLIISFSSILIIINSKDNSTLSNYLDIPVNYIYGEFKPDFEKKLLYGNLSYNFHAVNGGNQIIFDTYKLNIKKVYKVTFEHKEENYEEINFSFGQEDENLGVPLIIPIDYKKDDYLTINIIYETTPEGDAVQFLSKEQTFGGKYPCFFTQSEMIKGRSLLPCQDTPAIKVQFDLSIIVPKELRGMISGIFKKEEIYSEDNNLKLYEYKEENDVPNYLIALAAGNFDKKNITDNIYIFSEPEILDNVYNELYEDLPKVYNLSIEYMGPYRWKYYSILVLPKSFPFSGMENPSLNFISPCLINGDKSLTDIIFHELIHSWSGNLVTNENWSDFWLNEGITMFLQRKIVGKLWNNPQLARMDGYVGQFYIRESIDNFGEEGKEYTKLKPNLEGVSPDDVFSDIPYEKGYNFVYHLEHLIGEDLMQHFFESYFNHFEYKSIDFYQFKNYFLDFCRNNIFNNITDDILEKINWTSWIFTPGDIPEKIEEEDNEYKIQADEIVEKIKNESFEDLDQEFLNLSSISKTYILLSFEYLEDILTDKQHEFFTETLKLYENQNFLVSTNYYRIILGQTDKFLEHELDSFITYLSNYSAVDYLVGLYELFYKRDEVKAQETLEKLKNFYHISMYQMAEEEIEKAKKEFPIMKLDVGKDKYYYPYDDIFELKVSGYNKKLGKLNIDNGIYLISDQQNELKLNCVINNYKQFCELKDAQVLTFGEFTLKVKERIQKMNYAVKVSESQKFQIKKFDIDEDQTERNLTIEFDPKNEVHKIQIILKEETDFLFPVCFDNHQELNLKCDMNNKIYECELNRTFYNRHCYNETEKHKISMISLSEKTYFDIDLTIKTYFDKKTGDDDNDDNTKLILAIVLPCSIVVIAIIVILIYCLYFRKRKENSIENSGNDKMTLLAEV